MNAKAKEITSYFRSAIAAQVNMGIDFKIDKYYAIELQEFESGKIDANICKSIFDEANKTSSYTENDSKKISHINVIICAKTIKTIFEANEKTQDEIAELTGLFYIPAVFSKEGELSYNSSSNKLPWFPREYLQPMIEPKLAIGKASSVDDFISSNVYKELKIESWKDVCCKIKIGNIAEKNYQ